MRTQEIIDRLPYELASRLASDPYFADIPIVVADEGNVQATIAKKQAAITAKGGKWGIAVVVLQIEADDESSEVTFGPMRLRPAFQVVEQREQNMSVTGTGKRCRQVSRHIVTAIKSMSLCGLTTGFVCDKPAIEAVPLDKDLAANFIAGQVNFVTYEQSDEVLAQVSAPTLAVVGGAVQIASATDGAAIWFTTDGSYPRPVVPGDEEKNSSQLYAGPIAIPAGGFTVRACAYIEGMVASAIPIAEITE